MKHSTHYQFATVGVFVLLLLCVGAPAAQATHFADQIRGKILLDIENDGAAWYVYPVNDHRYSLGSGKQAYKLMRTLGLGITNENLQKIPQEGDLWNAEPGLMEHVQGHILLQVEKNGEAWYVNPQNGRRYYMANGKAAYQLMGDFGLGITAANLEHIPLTQDPNEPLVDYTSAQTASITTSSGTFSITVITLQKSRYLMVTDTANETDCDDNCPVKPLADYVQENNADIGIHGTYFCPSDYAACAGKVNSFLPPVFNTATDKMINEDALKFHTGPLMTFTSNSHYHYYHRAIDFGYTVAEWEALHKPDVVAGLTQYPSLVEDSEIAVNDEPMDDNQKNLHATRGAIGFNSGTIFLVVAKSATVPDLATIMKQLGSTYAMNLDGGASAALYYNGSYLAGPGRLLPNAIVFRKR